MNNLIFNELLASVKEAKKIMDKQAEPSRVFILIANEMDCSAKVGVLASL